MAENKETSETGEKPNVQATPQGKNWLEWLIFGLSSALVVAVLCYLGYQSLTIDHRMPNLKAVLGEPIQDRNRTQVPVTVYNFGDITAENVEIEVTAPSGDSGSFTLAFVPRGARRQGWAVFDKPLRKDQLKAVVKGYEEP